MAQMVEQLLLNREMSGSNPVISKFYPCYINENKEKEAKNGSKCVAMQFLKVCVGAFDLVLKSNTLSKNQR